MRPTRRSRARAARPRAATRSSCASRRARAPPRRRGGVSADRGGGGRPAAQRRGAALWGRGGGGGEAVAVHLRATERAGDDGVVATLRGAADGALAGGAAPTAVACLRRA